MNDKLKCIMAGICLIGLNAMALIYDGNWIERIAFIDTTVVGAMLGIQFITSKGGGK